MTSPRLGALALPTGTSFRVWAPHAASVRVLVQTGKKSWDSGVPPLAAPLTRSGGYWEALVPGVGALDIYRYEITHGEDVFETLDPAARATMNSWNYFGIVDNSNAGIIEAPVGFAWAPFRTPWFEDFLIYEFHVGSFAGRNDEYDRMIATFDDVRSKLGYIRDLNFTAIQPLPVQEFSLDRSWGYDPALYFTPESAYGSPDDLRTLVDEAHRIGLAVIFDVVYNHLGDDNSLWEFDGYRDNGGIYFEGGEETPWGRGPALWKTEVQDFFYQNARMYLEEYNADGLRFDATTQMNGNDLAKIVGRLRADFPDKYFIAEHLPADPWITTLGNFSATWQASGHHETQRALAGQDPVNKVLGLLGFDGYASAWNLVRYLAGSHDDIGDENNGNAEDGVSNWDTRHRYLIDQLGGRDDWTARAKVRLAWALNVALPGTPMAFMGTECLMGAPHVAWGYWHDGPDLNGDHRFDWSIAGDAIGLGMRNLVRDANAARLAHKALRSDTLRAIHRDDDNRVIAFKRWDEGGSIVLTLVNLGDRSFGDHAYGVPTDGQFGRWRQVLCSQDAAYGGWDGAGNAFHEPSTQADGRIYVNVPKLCVLFFVWLGD
jgi:1,4-alpha-glucan branching enzyme